MAIEQVYIWINNSIMQDEVLAHRLGLVPIKADPRQFEWMEPNADPTDQNTLVFRLDVACPPAENNEDPPPTLTVYSRSLEWMPQGSQAHFERTPAGMEGGRVWPLKCVVLMIV